MTAATGKAIRLGRLLPGEGARGACFAFDHGLQVGPIAGTEDLRLNLAGQRQHRRTSETGKARVPIRLAGEELEKIRLRHDGDVGVGRWQPLEVCQPKRAIAGIQRKGYVFE